MSDEAKILDELRRVSPADGLITGLATVNSALFGAERARCAVMSYDYTVLAGTQGTQNHYKKDRLFELAERLHPAVDALVEARRSAIPAGRFGSPDEFGALCAYTMDGETLGEVMFRGNIVMKGYLKDRRATEEAFAGGWFHSGDLAVMQPDGYIKIKDRSKDIIISGGENISSLEVEDALYRHPAVMACAVASFAKGTSERKGWMWF